MIMNIESKYILLNYFNYIPLKFILYIFSGSNLICPLHFMRKLLFVKFIIWLSNKILTLLTNNNNKTFKIVNNYLFLLYIRKNTL